MAKKKQKEKKAKRKSGSILVGVILMLIMISSIAIAVIGRSRQGAIIATDSRKGYEAYQNSDSNTENILNEIKKLDSADLRIPESVPASEVCDGTCYASDETSVASKVADIFFIKREGESRTLARAIFAPVPDRVANPLSDLDAVNGFPNRCNVRLNLTYSASADGSDISSLEVRKSSSSYLESGDWSKLSSSPGVNFGTTAVTVNNKEFTYGTKYYFSLKAKNKDPFQLDSLYFDKPNLPFFNTLPHQNCSSGQRLGCLPSGIVNSQLATAAYNCCGGTECYECNVGWKVTGSCCTQIKPTASCPCGVLTVGHENSCAEYTPDVCKTCAH